jgi:hypothetical protein
MNNVVNLNEAKEKFKKMFKNKAAIYQLINKLNGKTYIGSSINLDRRISEYLNPLYITRNLKKGNSKIMNALLKYGYINFGVKVLEVIELNLTQKDIKSNILAIEQYYIDLLKPEYNINKTAGSNLGRTFSNEIRKKMSLAKLGKVGNKKGAILSKERESKVLFREKSGVARKILLLNANNELLTNFNSIQQASESTGISRNRISRCARNIRKYIIEKGIIYKFKYDEIS